LNILILEFALQSISRYWRVIFDNIKLFITFGTKTAIIKIM